MASRVIVLSRVGEYARTCHSTIDNLQWWRGWAEGLGQQTTEGDGPSHLVGILRAVTEQEIVDRIAVLAKPRLTTLLRLRNVRHVYDHTPGVLNSTVIEDGEEVTLNNLKRASQPYRDIGRFLGEDKVMQYIVGPGVLPVVTALSKSIMGKKLLVTRKLAAMADDKGVVGHLDGFGVRVVMHFDEAADDTIVAWECLYGVL